MKRARIYRPSKTAMQSGRAGTEHWVLEFEPATAQRPDPLMGWIGSANTQTQVKLTFGTQQEAVEFARSNGFSYELELPQERHIKPKVYADNFRYGRREMWTH